MKSLFRKNTKHYLILGLVVSFVECLAWQPAVAETTSYRFGVVPQQSSSQLIKAWAPFVEYVRDKTGVQLKLETARNIPIFEKRAFAGRYDFSYMNPYHYVVYSDSTGYEAFAKAKDKKLKGIVVVHADSQITQIENLIGLKDLKIALPSPKAFAASILVRQNLLKKGINFTPVYVSSHDSVYRNIEKQHFPVGGGVYRTLKASPLETQKKIKVIYETKGYTPHAFAAHPRVPSDIVQKVRQAMLMMDASESGKQVLRRLRIKAFESATDSNWNDVRELELTELK